MENKKLINDKVLYLDDKIKIEEKTFVEHIKYIDGPSDDEIAKLNSDWDRWRYPYGENNILNDIFFEPKSEIAVYTDEERLMYGGRWREYDNYIKCLYVNDNEMYSETQKNLEDLIDFKLRDGMIFASRKNTPIKKSKNKIFGFKIDTLKKFENSSPDNIHIITAVEKQKEEILGVINNLDKEELDIKSLFPKFNISEYDNNFYKKRIPYMSLQQISMLSDEEKKNIPDEDIIKYAYIDISKDNKAIIDYVEKVRIFNCLKEMKLPDEKLISCFQTYYGLSHSSIKLPLDGSTIQYLELLMIKNNMDISDDNDKDLQKFRNYLNFINMKYKDLKKLSAKEIVNNILLLKFYKIRDFYSSCSYEEIENLIDYLEMSPRKTESCKKYLFNLENYGSKCFNREEIADILGIDYFKKKNYSEKTDTRIKNLYVNFNSLNKLKGSFNNNTMEKARQKCKKL